MPSVISTVPAYVGLTGVPAGEARRRAWVEQYEAAHQDVFAVYYDGYGGVQRRADAADAVDRSASLVAGREQVVRHVMGDAAAELRDHGLLHREEFRAVLMVGTGYSDAWVALLRGEPAIFVALEMLRDTGADELLILHELVHLAHVQHHPDLVHDPATSHTVAMRVWAEGVAVALSRLLRPGLPDTAYLSVDDGWIERCMACRHELRATIADNLRSNDASLVYSVLGVTDEHPWPARAGYLIGEAVVREQLDAGASPAEVLTWGPDRVVDVMRDSAALRP